MKTQFIRRFCIGLLAALFVQAAVGETMSHEDHKKLMQSNSVAMDAVDSAVAAAKYNDARENVAVLRKNLMTLRTYWSAQSRTDALQVVGQGIGQLAAIEELLGRREPNAERIKAATQAFRSDILSKLPQ